MKSLRNYLHDLRIELLEETDYLKTKMLNEDFTESERYKLDLLESKLEVVREVINICITRRRY